MPLNPPPIEIISRQIISEEKIFNNHTCPFPLDTSFTDIFKRVKLIIIKTLTVESSKVKLHAKLEDDLGADSLDEVELIMEYEKEFSIKVPDEDLCKLSTVNNAVLYIQKKLRQKNK